MAQLSHQMAQAAEDAQWDQLLELEPLYLKAFEAFVEASKLQAGPQGTPTEARSAIQDVLRDNARLVQAVTPWLASMRPQLMQSVAHNALTKAYGN